MSAPERVAVVGAGLAGLAAARRLQTAGAEVVVFEKARGAGGRTSTRRGDGGAFDHGAQYFTCRTPRFSTQLESWLERGVAERWEGTIVALGASSAVSKLEDAVRYVGMPRMSMLARDLASELRLETGARVVAAHSRAGGWALSFESRDDAVGFDTLVVATPAPQAVPLLAAVPALAERAGSVSMQPCHAAMVRFTEAPGLGFDGAFVADAALGWVARNASKPGRDAQECWVLHSTPEWSARHLEASPDEIAQVLLEALANQVGKRLPPTSWSATHRWLLARTAAPLAMPAPWDPGSRVGLCGDWIRGSRVEDAFLCGDELGEAILA